MAKRETSKKPARRPSVKAAAKARAMKTPKATKAALKGARGGGGVLRKLLKWTFVAGIWSAVALLGLIAYYAHGLPDISNLALQERTRSVRLFDRQGQSFASYGAYHGEALTVAQLPAHLATAVVATEDRRFYDHFGLDLRGLARAMLVNIRSGRVRQGGSTLTQQLAKNIFLTPERSVQRKVQELLLAFWLEARFSKAEILTIYLNRVYFGAGAYGVDAAARSYFGKSARQLTLPESALLAGMLKAPSNYNPVRNPQAARQRMAQVLANMATVNAITTAEAQRWAGKLPTLRGAASSSRSHRYMADWIFERASALTGAPPQDLVVETTLDVRVQTAAEAVVTKFRPAARQKGAAQIAVVVLGLDGAVQAMVGGFDYRRSQFNRATQARRQPGSAFKPMVYIAALEAGLRPQSQISDQPITIDGWRPRNYDGKYLGQISLTEALAGSRNAATVRLAEQLGREQVINLARRLGATANFSPTPSLSLGVSEMSPLALASLYVPIANGGFALPPYGVRAVKTAVGKTLFRHQPGDGTAALSPAVSADISTMLAAVIDTGTGRAAASAGPRAVGKTGTSQGFRDAWFAGFDDRRVVVVWLGNDDGRPMDAVSGGGLPAKIWAAIMAAARRS